MRHKAARFIAIGLQRMITWPVDAAEHGQPAKIRGKGAWVMFAGAPYTCLHVCGTPRDGNEYRDGDKPVWSMVYAGR